MGAKENPESAEPFQWDWVLVVIIVLVVVVVVVVTFEVWAPHPASDVIHCIVGCDKPKVKGADACSSHIDR